MVFIIYQQIYKFPNCLYHVGHLALTQKEVVGKDLFMIYQN